MLGTEFNFKFYLETNNEETKTELQRLSHHIDFLVDLDNSEECLTFWQVEVKEENGYVVISGVIDTNGEEVELEDLQDELYDLIITEDYEDLELYDIELSNVE